MISVGVVDIDSEIPFTPVYVDRAEEVILSHESSVLVIRQHPTQVVITNIECLIVVVHCPFITSFDIIYNVADGIHKIVIDLIHIIALSCREP